MYCLSGAVSRAAEQGLEPKFLIQRFTARRLTAHRVSYRLAS
jgi:hypothetical protein